MTRIPLSTSSEQSIYSVLELSKNGLHLAIQVPGRDGQSLYPIGGGNAEGLMAKLDAARDRVAKVSPIDYLDNLQRAKGGSILGPIGGSRFKVD